MKKLPFYITISNALKIIVGLFILDFILTSLVQHNIPRALWRIVFILFSGAFLTLFSMVIKRLITTKWGNFLHGMLVFSFLNGLLYIFFAFKHDVHWLLLVAINLIGVIIFIIYEKYIVFEKRKKKSKKQKKEKFSFKNIFSFINRKLSVFYNNGICQGSCRLFF